MYETCLAQETVECGITSGNKSELDKVGRGGCFQSDEDAFYIGLMSRCHSGDRSDNCCRDDDTRSNDVNHNFGGSRCNILSPSEPQDCVDQEKGAFEISLVSFPMNIEGCGGFGGLPSLVANLGSEYYRPKASGCNLVGTFSLDEPSRGNEMTSNDGFVRGARRSLSTPSSLPSKVSDDSKSLLFRSPLPPELCVSDGIGAGRDLNGLYNTVENSSFSLSSTNHLLTSAYDVGKSSIIESRQNDMSSSGKLESEDSSYDSDQGSVGGQTLDSFPWPPSTQASSKDAAFHDDISRTSSETLAAEFEDYVTTSKNAQVLVEIPSKDFVKESEEYKAKVMFGLKLGYSENLLRKALNKLGPGTGENQLLEELIRLQKSNTKPIAITLTSPTSSSYVGGKCGDGSNRYPHRLSSSIDVWKDATASSMKSFNADSSDLLPIVVDGSNVAMSHGSKDRFSCKGIQICVEWFQTRGHTDITVFVPKWRKEASKPDTPITDQHILTDLEKKGLLAFTPSRQVRGKRFVCHDDRYILNLAADNGAIVVSNDNFRDLIVEKPEFKDVIEERILMYSFVNDRFMPPDDPLGRNGPTLDAFLRKKSSKFGAVQQPCPYGKKCTYGNKCKFFHAERGNQPQKSITDSLKERSTQKINEIWSRSRDSSPGEQLEQLLRTKSVQTTQQRPDCPKQSLCRTKSSVPWLDAGGDRVLPTSAWHNQLRPSDFGDSLSHACVANYEDTFPTDTSLLPPRSPWNAVGVSPAEEHCSDHSINEEASLHRKLARQLTLNPSYDPRIRPEHQRVGNSTASIASHPFPPPTGIPPPPLVGYAQHHAAVTRNASAPEQLRRTSSPSLLSGRYRQQETGQQPLFPPRHQEVDQSQFLLHHQEQVEQEQQSGSSTALHKTMSADSCVTGWRCFNNDVVGGCYENVFSSPSSSSVTAVSPLISSSTSVWGESGTLNNLSQSVSVNNLGPIGSSLTSAAKSVTRKSSLESRSNLYFHLSALFPDCQVRQAMSALPEETDPQKICKFILYLNQK